MSAKGGITEGKSHKEGGIPMVVKSTGQHVELEGGEGVINKRNMASEKTFEFEGKEKTICEIASEINSADGNGVQIDCDNVTGKKYKYKKGGNILSKEEEQDFDAWFEDGNVYEIEDGVYATQDYQWNNRIKGKEELKKFYAKEYLDRRYAEGGGVDDYQIYVYSDEESPTGKIYEIEDLRFPTLDGAKKYAKSKGYPINIVEMYYGSDFKKGGSVEDYQSLIGKYVNIYSMGVSLPTEHQIKDVMVSGENFRYRYITLKFDIGIAPIPFNEGIAFMSNQIIFVNDNKEEFGIQLIPNQYAKGGRMPNTLKLEDYETASMSAGGYEEQMIVPQSTTGMYANGGGVSSLGYYTAIANMGVRKIKRNLDSVLEVQEFMTEMADKNAISVEITKINQEGKKQTIVYEWSGSDWEIISKSDIYKEGGNVPKASKMFHLPLELAVYVPSTQNVDEVISEGELNARVNEVSKYLASTFGGFTKSERVGGFMTSKSELVTEDVVPVVSFATKEDYEANKEKLVEKLSEWARKWGQEAIGFEFEGDLYYVPQKFDKGGDVRDFDWYQGFKKKQLKKGTEHEMEHIDTIREFKKEGVSDREVAEAIAKDHLEEDENYYIELEKMESSRKVSESIKDFEKHKGYRKNSLKFKQGGYMGGIDDTKEMVHITFNSDVDAVIRDKQGKFISEKKYPKDHIYKFIFKYNDGYCTLLEILKGAYIIVPNKEINIVGFNEEKFGVGGSVKPFQSIPLTENDKEIAKLLTYYENDSDYNSNQRQKLSTFRGNNVVNELSRRLIQKMYGLLFEYHNIQNPIKELYLSNVGAGNLVSFAPKYIDKLMISFDEQNRFVEMEKEINAIVNIDKTYTLFTNTIDLRSIDAIIYVYSNSNPEKEELIDLLNQSEKSLVALGVCEFTSRERLNKFQQQIVENQGSSEMNEMVQKKYENKYLIVKEGITNEGEYTLIYVITKY
jgi:hypothetical protein